MIEDDLRLLHAVLVEAVHQNTDSLTVNSVQGVPRVPQDVEEQFDVVLVPVDDQVVQHLPYMFCTLRSSKCLSIAALLDRSLLTVSLLSFIAHLSRGELPW